MDAKVGDWVVTPRRGKPVEIQALWYNALAPRAVADGGGGTIIATAEVAAPPERVFQALTSNEVERWCAFASRLLLGIIDERIFGFLQRGKNS